MKIVMLYKHGLLFKVTLMCDPRASESKGLHVAIAQLLYLEQ